ncbi:MAG: hypothetical protein SOR89_05030 [Ndongobacter sp.]|nr:hypothetical protein [Ndongobacter sp.]
MAQYSNSGLLEVLFREEDRCVFCQDAPKLRYGLCASCFRELELVHVCRSLEERTARPYEVYSAGFYNNFLKELFARYKFSGQSYLEEGFCEMLSDAVGRYERLRMRGWVCSVPMLPHQKTRRGYNAAEELAKGVARRRQLLYVCALQKKRRTREQNKVSSLERKHNVQDVFRIAADRHGLFRAAYFDVRRGRFVSGQISRQELCEQPGILVDDFVTSGNTLREAGAVLRMAGIQVDGLTLATSHYPKEDE